MDTHTNVSDSELMRRDVFKRRRGRLSESEVSASKALVQERAQRLAALKLDLNAELPVSQAEEELTKAIRDHQVVVVAGETGSGKTTQLPKLLLRAGLGVRGLIGHTQPRRLAARTVASRIAEETETNLGEEVGFAVRFTDAVADHSLVKVMTDGLLLNEVRTDRFLDNYDAIIVDEAHERSLNIDFLLGFLKRLIRKRKDLKVIITSATIDVDRFSAFFASGLDEPSAPVVSVGGRTFPVEVEYLEAPTELIDGVSNALEDIATRPYQGASDVLIFCSGEREIFELARDLRKRFFEQFEILPLYARLSFSEQRKVFSPSGSKRRVVIATNVAETSITVPNIGFVIDPGMARINRYSYRSKLQRLPIEPISQASANQRKGRCGRIAPGVCFRLYEENDFVSRPEFTDPEIRRVNLAGAVLQMQAFNLGEIHTFPFIDPPDPKAVKDALRLLDELQALKGGKITKLGRQMARLPVDVRLARMLVEGHQQGALDELLVIASGLAVQDPRERPMQKSQTADQSHQVFLDERSDFISYLNLWRWLDERKEELTNNKYKQLLEKRFINFLRVREWREVHRQLRTVCRELGWKLNSNPASYSAIHESIVAGSLSLIGQHDERGEYRGARNLKLRIFPGSGLAGKSPKWIISGEVTETSRVYARTVAKVEPGWIERHGEHLVKRRYSEPTWVPKRGEVVAKVTVSLYGLVLADGRTTSYDKIDAGVCRELFIRDALVAGAMEPMPPFLRDNLELVREVQDLEAKSRRRDILVSDDLLRAFYAEKIPANITRTKDLNKWIKRPDNEASLRFTKAFLLQTDDASLPLEDFPSTLECAGSALTLKYRFAPGEKNDGVTLVVPVGVLSAISSEELEWSIPGLFSKVVEEWLRTLPKSKRKKLAPMPEKVEAIAEFLRRSDRYRQGRLLSALQDLLRDWYKISVDESDWDRARMQDHLRFYVSVVDAKGREIRGGRDLNALKSAAQSDASEVAPKQIEQHEHKKLTQFPAKALKASVVLGSKSARVIKYPGFSDNTDSVDVKLFDTAQERDQSHRDGLIRLALINLGQVGRYFRKELDKHPHMSLHFATLGTAGELKEEILRSVVWRCYFEGEALPDEEGAFKQRLEERRPHLAGVFTETVDALAEILKMRFECGRSLLALESKAYDQSKADIETHLNELVPANVVSATPGKYFGLVPRYLAGIQRRLDNLPGHVPKDIGNLELVRPYVQRISKLKETELYEPAKGDALRFLLEEVRLVLFAEQVARKKVTNHPIGDVFGGQWKASLKRLDTELTKEERRVGLS